MNEKPTVDRRADCIAGRENVTREAVSGEVFEELREHNCRDCKGFFGPDDDCPECCDQMQAALAIEVLGLTEYWDGSTSSSSIVSTGQTQLLVRMAREKLKEAKRETQAAATDYTGRTGYVKEQGKPSDQDDFGTIRAALFELGGTIETANTGGFYQSESGKQMGRDKVTAARDALDRLEKARG